MKPHFWAYYILKRICPAVVSDFSDKEYIFQVSKHVCWIDVLNIIIALHWQQVSGILHTVL